MKQLPKRLISFFVLISLIFSLLVPVSAEPATEDIITTPSGYTTATDVVYNIVDGYVTNWGARGEDCTFLSTYAASYYTDGIGYDDLSQLSGGTSTSDAPESALYAALQSVMVDSHTTFTKYGGSTAVDCKNFYLYTDCMLGDTAYVSTLYRGELVGGAWDGGVSYNQEHVWPQSKCIGTASQDIGDIMQLRPANPGENSSRNNTAYGESADYYDPGVSVRGDCARTLLYLYTRWGNTGNMWGTEGVIESLEILLRWIEEDPVDTWEMGHNDAVQSITGVRNVFVDYPEYAWLLFGEAVPADVVTPSGGEDATQTAALVTDASALTAGDKVIIVAADDSYALSTEQKTNNRGQAAVTKSEDGTTVTFGTDTQLLELTEGTVSGTFGLRAGENGYLSAASSSANYLKSTTDLTDDGSWSVTIDASTGVASISASGTYTRNTLRYNASSDLFACYDAATTQQEVKLYKLQEADTSGGTEDTDTTTTTATLVTDASTLKAGDQIIIVAADYDYALSTEQKTSNRGQAAVTKDGTTVTFGTDTQIITLQEGTVSGTFGLYTGEGHLRAASSFANNLKTAADLTDDGSWAISIDSTTGYATVTASGTYTRNTLRYNATSSLFSCYAASNSQKDIRIYKLSTQTTDPGLSLSYPTLSFEDEIIYNVYYTVSDASSVVEMGLMLLSSYNADATIDDATQLIPGYVTNGTIYLASSEGVAAANMGDTLYFKVYAKLTDGSYAYSDAGGYNAKAYANSILNGEYTDEMKSLVVAMVNYGAEAQLYFGHNTDKLVNAALTDKQKALVAAYDETMVDAVVSADSSKTGNFVRVNSNFSSLYPSVSFDGAFSINFYCTPAITVDSGMTLYWWDAETYASIDEFTIENATGSMEMTESNGQYWGNVPGIAAKEMDKTYYVSCVFESEGETITTGIIAYSLGKYCEGKAATDGDAQQAFAQATAVYGYYAKQYFASIA